MDARPFGRLRAVPRLKLGTVSESRTVSEVKPCAPPRADVGAAGSLFIDRHSRPLVVPAKAGTQGVNSSGNPLFLDARSPACAEDKFRGHDALPVARLPIHQFRLSREWHRCLCGGHDTLRIFARAGLRARGRTGAACLPAGRLHPENRYVRPKIRQQLQILRDLGFVEFLGRGSIGLRGSGFGNREPEIEIASAKAK